MKWLALLFLVGCGSAGATEMTGDPGGCGLGSRAAICGDLVTVVCTGNAEPPADRCTKQDALWCCMHNWATPLADGGAE
jgi:hypothetical protein